MKILIFRSGAIGDVLMTTPLVRAVRKNYPNANITYLCGEWSRKAILNNPNIDKIISYPDEIIFKRNIIRLFFLILKLRNEKFDIAYVLDKSKWFGLLVKMAGIPERIGFDRAGEGKYNTKNIKYSGDKHEIDYYLDILKLSDIKPEGKNMDFFISPKDISFAKRYLKDKGINGRIIGIAPGGAVNPGESNGLRRWPEERYIELIDLISEKDHILLFGGKRDKEICERIIIGSNHKNIINLAGKFNFSKSAAIIKFCNKLVTHDSGLMHLAVALGVNIVAIFGPTDPKIRLYVTDNGVKIIVSNVKCRPCYMIDGGYNGCTSNKCMQKVSAKSVFNLLNLTS